MRNVIVMLLLLCAGMSLSAQENYQTTSRMKLDPAMAPFYHGVASGDPLSDAVIIWTRITLPDTLPATVNWKMATDIQFTNIVASGSATTDAAKDFTVNVDVTGLQPYTYYYYFFEHDGKKSIMGRTKTAPAGDNDHVRFAVVSCSRYVSGYFNVYNHIATRNDIDAVIHLGDYIYESGTVSSFDTTRKHEPLYEIIELEDYRGRYSQYRLDPDLRDLHQQYPWMTTWDDHETTNDAWYGGAENHDTTEGNWFDRKSYANMAYFEWMPVRDPGGNPGAKSIYREISYGDLLDIMILDTRIEGRDEQSGTGASVQNDTARTILGKPQFNWLTNNLKTSSAQWKLLAQQVMMAPLEAFGFAVNGDQWDGYPVERTRLFDTIMNYNIEDVVVITGDIHTSWGNDLPHPNLNYDANTGNGSVGVEFVVSSVTSGTAGILSGLGENIVKSANAHIKYTNLADRGFLILDITKSKAQSDWHHVSTVEDTNYLMNYSASWYMNDGERFLREGNAEAPPIAGQAPLAPLGVNQSVSVDEVPNVITVGAYPNPFEDVVTLQYYVNSLSDIQLSVVDLSGKRVLQREFNQHPQGVHYFHLNTSNLSTGVYLLLMESNGQVFRTKLIKGK